MCRIEEHIVIEANGAHRTTEEHHYCDKAPPVHPPRFCNNVERRRTGYYPKQPTIGDDVPSLASLNPPTPPLPEYYDFRGKPQELSKPRKSSSDKPMLTIQIGSSKSRGKTYEDSDSNRGSPLVENLYDLTEPRTEPRQPTRHRHTSEDISDDGYTDRGIPELLDPNVDSAKANTRLFPPRPEGKKKTSKRRGEVVIEQAGYGGKKGKEKEKEKEEMVDWGLDNTKDDEKDFLKEADEAAYVNSIGTESRQVSCSQCGQVFHGLYRTGNLRRHMKFSHSNIPRPSCTICGKLFSRLDALASHMRRTHPEPGQRSRVPLRIDRQSPTLQPVGSDTFERSDAWLGHERTEYPERRKLTPVTRRRSNQATPHEAIAQSPSQKSMPSGLDANANPAVTPSHADNVGIGKLDLKTAGSDAAVDSSTDDADPADLAEGDYDKPLDGSGLPYVHEPVARKEPGSWNPEKIFEHWNVAFGTPPANSTVQNFPFLSENPQGSNIPTTQLNYASAQSPSSTTDADPGISSVTPSLLQKVVDSPFGDGSKGKQADGHTSAFDQKDYLNEPNKSNNDHEASIPEDHAYDSDDAYPRSPGLKPVKPKATPSPPPPPFIPQRYAVPTSQLVNHRDTRRPIQQAQPKTRPIQDDTVLLGFMAPDRPDLARLTGRKTPDSGFDSDGGAEAESDEDQFEFSVDPSKDPESALHLQMLEGEGEALQDQERKAKEAGDVSYEQSDESLSVLYKGVYYLDGDSQSTSWEDEIDCSLATKSIKATNAELEAALKAAGIEIPVGDGETADPVADEQIIDDSHGENQISRANKITARYRTQLKAETTKLLANIEGLKSKKRAIDGKRADPVADEQITDDSHVENQNFPWDNEIDLFKRELKEVKDRERAVGAVQVADLKARSAELEAALKESTLEKPVGDAKGADPVSDEQFTDESDGEIPDFPSDDEIDPFLTTKTTAAFGAGFRAGSAAAFKSALEKNVSERPVGDAERVDTVANEQITDESDRGRQDCSWDDEIDSFHAILNTAQLRAQTAEARDSPARLVEDDNFSVVSSDHGSVFSITSLASSATDLSKASGYSASQIATATREILLILQDDEVLSRLYTVAIQSDVIGPQRFANNFRRLLKKYSEHLKDEAKDRLDHLAAQLVAVKARPLAQSILERFQGEAVTAQPTPNKTDVKHQTERNDESSDDEGGPPVDESIFQDLVIVRDFLVESDAFQTLRSQFQQFVVSQSSTNKRIRQSHHPVSEHDSGEKRHGASMNHAEVGTEVASDVIHLLPGQTDADVDIKVGTKRKKVNWAVVELFESILQRQEELHPLHQNAVKKLRSSDFQKQYCRVLKRYALQLRNEARNDVQRIIAQLLKSRAHRSALARRVLDHGKEKLSDELSYQPIDTRSVENWTRNVDSAFETGASKFSKFETETYAQTSYGTDSGDEADYTTDDEEAYREGFRVFGEVSQVERFLSGGPPFQTLIVELRLLALPTWVREMIRSTPKCAINVSSGNDISFSNRAKAIIEDYTESEWDWWPLVPRVPDVSPGKSRLHWKFCGEHLYEEILAEEADSIREILEKIDDCSLMDSAYESKAREINSHFSSSLAGQTSQSSAQQRYTPATGATTNVSSTPLHGSNQTNIQAPAGNTASCTQAYGGRPCTYSAAPQGNPLCVVFGVKDSQEFDQIENIEISIALNDPSFFKELKMRYKKYRWFFQRWCSPFRFRHCKFVQFEKISSDQVYCCGEALPDDHGYGSHYEYHPRPPMVKNPPINPKLFAICLRACDATCYWSLLPSFLHKCRPLPPNSHKWKRIPRKKGAFNACPCQPEEVAFGIEADYAMSFAVLFVYHLILIFSAFGFWIYWLRYHPGDLQNASVPTFTVLALITAFWGLRGWRIGGS